MQDVVGVPSVLYSDFSPFNQSDSCSIIYSIQLEVQTKNSDSYAFMSFVFPNNKWYYLNLELTRPPCTQCACTSMQKTSYLTTCWTYICFAIQIKLRCTTKLARRWPIEKDILGFRSGGCRIISTYIRSPFWRSVLIPISVLRAHVACIAVLKEVTTHLHERSSVQGEFLTHPKLTYRNKSGLASMNRSSPPLNNNCSLFVSHQKNRGEGGVHTPDVAIVLVLPCFLLFYGPKQEHIYYYTKDALFDSIHLSGTCSWVKWVPTTVYVHKLFSPASSG
jgi:hypothetical protein